ncbi:MAG: hypothetical protein HOD01_01680 [Oceanospirillaceae bacterium]|jgi:hypothetical protein|nr:hypothetical protein [Oceanospirillaceae bacterium]
MDDNDILLSMDGVVMHRDDGYWWKIDVKQVPVTSYQPAGVKYNLTLHNSSNLRIFGYDNAHRPKLRVGRAGKARNEAYDHVHKSASGKGSPYQFVSCTKLLEDFFVGVDEVIHKLD